MKTDQSIGIIPFFKEKNEYKFLIIQQVFGDWIFPKGHSIGRETDKQTVSRELYEETNITKCNIVDGFNDMVTYSFNKNGNTIEKKVTFFLGLIDNIEAKIISAKNSSGEVINIGWFSYEDALTKLSHDNHKKMFMKAFKYLKENYK